MIVYPPPGRWPRRVFPPILPAIPSSAPVAHQASSATISANVFPYSALPSPHAPEWMNPRRQTRLAAGTGMGGECPALDAAEERGEGGLGVDGEGKLPLEPRANAGV
jgi:hypothetical protein